MAGGLIQLKVYGAQDIFLTSAPQITFFKIVFRRHTNFSIESLQQYFIGNTNFGDKATSIIDKYGDLIGQIYLEIDIPLIDLKKDFDNDKINIVKHDLNIINNFYDLFGDYISEAVEIAKKIIEIIQVVNINLSDIRTIINKLFSTSLLKNKLIKLKKYIIDNSLSKLIDPEETDFILQQKITSFDLKNILDNLLNNDIDNDYSIKKNVIDFIRYKYYGYVYDYYIKIYNVLLKLRNTYQSINNKTYEERYNFAWVEELGHSILDYVEINIGNQKIDKQTGDWLIIYNRLFLPTSQTENYYKMIGNVNHLITFNNELKKSYKLIVPLQFWFCRNSGLAIPAISLRYHDILINIKLKELSKVCYTDYNFEILDMPNFQSLYNINIQDAKLYVDYIYLDSDERMRFAQTSHEYLIEYVQFTEFNGVNTNSFNAKINFKNPTKYIVWYAQPSYYRTNITGNIKCQWNNFGLKEDKTGYTMENSYLKINLCNLTDPNVKIKYFNYVQPYYYFPHSPTDGINVYSASLLPGQFQPSGSINLSRIDDFTIEMIFSPELMNLISNNNFDNEYQSIYVAVYAVSYNILRFMSGMAGLAFH